MSPVARQIMSTEVRTVEPDMSLPDLERAFFTEKSNGFPVVENGELVGLVEWGDVVGRLYLEQTFAEQASDDDSTVAGSHYPDAEHQLDAIGEQVGERLEHLQVRDVMSLTFATINPEASLREVADLMVQQRINRLPVVEGRTLAGLITPFDLVELLISGSSTNA